VSDVTTPVKERPINLRRHEVHGIRAGRKTQLRRIVKLQPRTKADIGHHGMGIPFVRNPDLLRRNHSCPYGKPGDRLWCKETWKPGYYHDADHEDGPKVSAIYQATNTEAVIAAPTYEMAKRWDREFSEDGHMPPRWRSPIVMPRWASRILLEVTDVRVERVQDISEADAVAEGAERMHEDDLGQTWLTHRRGFRSMWERTNGPGSWDANPWVWVLGFRRIEA